MRPHNMWGLIWDPNCLTLGSYISKNLDGNNEILQFKSLGFFRKFYLACTELMQFIKAVRKLGHIYSCIIIIIITRLSSFLPVAEIIMNLARWKAVLLTGTFPHFFLVFRFCRDVFKLLTCYWITCTFFMDEPLYKYKSAIKGLTQF